MKITSLEQIESFPMAMEGVLGVTKQVPVGKEDGTPPLFISGVYYRAGRTYALSSAHFRASQLCY